MSDNSMGTIRATISLRPYATLTPHTEEELMTTYHERLEAGEYQGDGPDHDAPSADDQGNGPTLAELRAQAEERGLPSYGSKAMLSDRIAAHDAAQSEDEDEDETE